MAWIGAAKALAGCVFCTARDSGDDRTTYLLERSDRAYLILNAYPYASGHLMAVVNRHVGTLADARTDELADMMRLVRRGVRAPTAEYRAEGFNVGMNQGRAAGAGIEDHLHIHVVPRWNGDSNFVTVLGDTRVLPETLETTWERLRGQLSG
jgi:ATP adenylyltransferase